jgi:uncharacterized protein (DUF488 family)
MPVVLHTIGHSRHAEETFVALLRTAGVERLIDVRSVPHSRFVPQFNQGRMRAWLGDAGIGYAYLGDRLGGKTRDPACLTDGKPDFAKIAARPGFAEGIEELVQLAADRPGAIMCAERDPLDCHRFHLIGPAVRPRDLALRHILADGTIEEDATTLARAAAPSPRRGRRAVAPTTPDLFGGATA